MEKSTTRQLLAGLIVSALLISPALYAGDSNKHQQHAEKQQWDDHKKKAMSSAKININQATATEIAKALPGIGMKKAQAIVKYRQQYGKFKEVDQLLKVKGIGKKGLAASRDYISLAAPK